VGGRNEAWHELQKYKPSGRLSIPAYRVERAQYAVIRSEEEIQRELRTHGNPRQPSLALNLVKDRLRSSAIEAFSPSRDQQTRCDDRMDTKERRHEAEGSDFSVALGLLFLAPSL